MKFVVTNHPYDNQVDVKLHWETKEKIKQIASWSLAGAAVVGSVLYITNDKNKKQPE